MSLRQRVNAHKQNKPSRLAREMETWGIPYDVAMEMLLRHGVMKWFACRRDIIHLREDMRQELTTLMTLWPRAQTGGNMRAAMVKVLNNARQRIRAICHSDRMRAPDHDRDALRWLAIHLND